jgi:hypothetical protein
MKKELSLIVFAFAGLPVSGLVIIISLIVVVIIVVGVIFLVRNGNKKKGIATGSSGDWQPQAQPGAWNQQGAWGQQGQGQWGTQNPAPQAGNWAGGPQNPWGTPAQQQQPPANPWGAPAQQQPTNPWEPAPAPAATSQDPWGQQQAAASPQQAWGMQAGTSAPVQQSQQAPTAFGASSPPAAGWGQNQQADTWGNPAASSPVAQPAGFQATGSPGGQQGWQQAGIGSPGAGFAGNEADKTVLRPAGQQNGVIGYVQVKEGKEPGRVYEIRKESLSIGRSRESDIFLEDLAVSRLHASIVNMGNGAYSLKDEGSANGTKVNDQLVDKFKTYPLQEGDQIQLGQTVLVFARH